MSSAPWLKDGQVTREKNGEGKGQEVKRKKKKMKHRRRRTKIHAGGVLGIEPLKITNLKRRNTHGSNRGKEIII